MSKSQKYIVRVIGPSGKETYIDEAGTETADIESAKRYPSESVARYSAINHSLRFRVFCEVMDDE